MDCLQLLPDEEGLEGKTYGIVNVSVSNLRVDPDFSSEMMTQGLMGMPVRVLQQMCIRDSSRAIHAGSRG